MLKSDTFLKIKERFINAAAVYNSMARMMSIYEALLNRVEKICYKPEIAKIIEEYNKEVRKISVKDAFKYLSRHKHIKRIFLNIYYINSVEERKRGFCEYEDKELLFTALNKLRIKWYLGLGYALYLNGGTWQAPNILHIINDRFSGARKILGIKVKFHKVKPSLIFGIKKAKTKHGINYFYSDTAKTYLDLAYLRESDRLIRTKGIAKYIKKYPKWLSKSI